MTAKSKGGRPKVKVDTAMLEQLAAINCTVDEMAAVMGCAKRTLERRFAAHIKKGREVGTMSLKRWQFEHAKKGNATLLIWLGKQYLGQRDFREPGGAIDDPQAVVRGIREMVGALFATAPPSSTPGGLTDDKPSTVPA